MYCTCMLYMCDKTQRGREGGRREKGGGRDPRKVPQYILRQPIKKRQLNWLSLRHIHTCSCSCTYIMYDPVVRALCPAVQQV